MSRYEHPTIDHAWTLGAKYAYWLRVEWAAAAELGDTATAQLLAPELTGHDVQIILKYEDVTRHDVGAFVRWMREVRGADSAHWGLSSSDLVDTGLCLAVQDVSSVLVREARSLVQALELMGAQYADLPRPARTHGVFAEPDFFGRQIGVWSDRIAKSVAALELTTGPATEVVLGGPIGDAKVHDAVRMAGLLNLPPGRWRKAQANDRTCIVLWGQCVAGLMSAVEHLALQIRLGATYGEMAEEFAEGQWGSTSMPHKHNPVRAERACGLARVVRAQASALAESTTWFGEHDISHSSVERICLPLLTGLTGFAVREMLDVVTHLVVNPDAMLQHVEHNGTWSKWLAQQQANPGNWAEIYRSLQP